MPIPTLTEAASSAALALHERADRLPSGKVASAAHTTADALQSTADYFRYQDFQGVARDLRQLVKRHPGATLLVAGALGFLLARRLIESRAHPTAQQIVRDVRETRGDVRCELAGEKLGEQAPHSIEHGGAGTKAHPAYTSTTLRFSVVDRSRCGL